MLATYDKNFSNLPDQFPARIILKLSGLRYLAYRQRRLSVTVGEKMAFEDITEQFPFRSFFLASEVARNMQRWTPLLTEIRRSVATATHGKPHSQELLAAITECEDSAGRAIRIYADSLRLAFGVRYDDVELRKERIPLSALEMPEILMWATCIRNASTELNCWLTDHAHNDHLVWQEAP